MNDIDPAAYPHYVIGHIAEHPVQQIDELLSWSVATLLPPSAHINPLRLPSAPSPSATFHAILIQRLR
jgi:transposase